MRKVLCLAIILATVATTVALADTPTQREDELQFSGDCTVLKIEGEPNIKNYSLDARWGYMLTDGHELGLLVGYQKYSAPPIDISDSSSSQQYGIWYNYNFKA